MLIDTCMTRWISLVASDGTSLPAIYVRQEKVLKSLLHSAGKTSTSDLDPSITSFIFRHNDEVTSLFLNCAGEVLVLLYLVGRLF